MSFTTLATVRKHLLASDITPLVFENLPVNLNREEAVLLPHQNLVEGSDVLKWDIGVLPLRDGPITLCEQDKARLSADHVIPGSMVVTPSDTLTTVYVEEADYHMNYADGYLVRVENGGLPNNQQVFVHYSRYSLFSGTTDYLLDAASGTLRRRSNSTIPDGATVLLDYRVTAGSITDSLIEQAIIEAEDQIVRVLAQEYTGQSNAQGLRTGTTLLVLSMVTRDLATEALMRRQSSDASGRAKEWQNLSALYEVRAWDTLRPYLDRFPVHAPERRNHG
jgi:hypothetical protein